MRRQNPTAENLSGSLEFNDIHRDSFRVALLLEPFEGFTSTTIYDYFKAKEQPGALYLYRHDPGVIPGLSDALDPQLADYRAGQIAAGYHAAYSGLGDTVRANRKLWGISNDSKLELGEITIRNIFGYRVSANGQTINTGGNGPLLFPVAPGVSVPFTLFTAASDAKRSYLTDEFQILGTLFDDRLNFIVGGFYNHDRPEAQGGSNFIAFSATGAPKSTTRSEAHKSALQSLMRISYAVFAFTNKKTQ